MTRLDDAAELGQAIWFDFVRRSYLDDGTLADLIKQGVRGVTSNPSIFEKAIAQSNDYAATLGELAREGRSAVEIYEALALEDIARTADLLRSVYDKTRHRDGFVSLEVDPRLAHDASRTVSEAKRLFDALGRANVMIKVPATQEGLIAVRQLVAEGVNVNVTLIFGIGQYDRVMDAYMSGIEDLVSRDRDPAAVHSVASVFVSRMDRVVDPLLAAMGKGHLKAKIAIDNARIIYGRFRELLVSDRWARLAAKGANIQRVLWGSTSTKDPAYPDTLYVDSLIGPDTVNTLPPTTLEAFLDHGTVAVTVDDDIAGAWQRLALLAGEGINLDSVAKQLLSDGVDAFAAAATQLLSAIEGRRLESIRG